MNNKVDKIKQNHARTLSAVRRLVQGKTIKLGNHTIGMGNDMSIGFVVEIKGDRGIWGLTAMDLRELDQLLTEYDIGEII